MATTDKAALLGWIVSRWKPTVAQFKAFAESYWHKSEKIPTSSIDGLDSIMSGVATEEFVTNSIAQYGQGVSELIAGLSAKAGITDKTYTDLAAMVANGTMAAGSLYKITDRGDRGIILRAVSASQLSRDGIRIMLCPSTYATGADTHGNNWIGVWHLTKTATFNCLAIWGGKVWRNLTGDIGTADGDVALDATNWQAVAKASFTNHEYTAMVFGCSFDFDNDWIFRQWDASCNVLGNDDDGKNSINYCDISDWNMATAGCYFWGNKCLGIFNNCISYALNANDVFFTISNNYSEYIECNRCKEIAGNTANNIWNNSTAIVYNTAITIDSNRCNGVVNNRVTGQIKLNSCGRIENNACADISGNNNSGDIINCSLPGYSIYFNRNNGGITVTGLGNITHNCNNGNILGAITSDVSDPIVNKTMSGGGAS